MARPFASLGAVTGEHAHLSKRILAREDAGDVVAELAYMNSARSPGGTSVGRNLAREARRLHAGEFEFVEGS